MTLEEALIQVESADAEHPEGNDHAIGDNGHAFGCLQIWQTYMKDALPGYNAEDCLDNRQLSLYAFRAYMKRYATAKRLGRLPTAEDIARIHNGGPNGWKKPQTLPYWRKVEALLNKK